MRYWQRAMVYCARHKGLTQAVHGSRLMRRFAGQFVAADTADAAIARMADMHHNGVRGSLFYLGEYVEDPAEVEATVSGLLSAIPKLAEQGLDVHVSVDPTQIGSLQSWDLCRENAQRLAEAVGQYATGNTSMLMLDMEDSSVTGPTLDVFQYLHGKGLPVAVTLQSYLHRTTDDLAAVITTGAPVRLVKGAFAEDAAIAHTARSNVDDAYRLHMTMLLGEQAKVSGTYPIFGTHDDRMMRYAGELAKIGGWRAADYEVEMLLGVRPALQRHLIQQGTRLRLYCPYGVSWWPYSVRRIGENPRNALFVLRSMAGV